MTLQMALILLAIVVVVGVYFYSRWEGPRSSSRLRDRQAGNRPGDRNFHSEPSFGETGNLYQDPQPGGQLETDFSAGQRRGNSILVDEGDDQGSIEYSIPPEKARPGNQAVKASVEGDDVLEDDAGENIAPAGGNPEYDTRQNDAIQEDQPRPNLGGMQNDDPAGQAGSDSILNIDAPVTDRLASDGAVVDEETPVGMDENQNDIPVLDSRVDSAEDAEQSILQVEDLPESPADDASVSERLEPVRVTGDAVEPDEQTDHPQRHGAGSAGGDATENGSINEDPDNDLDDKPSLKAIVGSMNPIQKLRGSIKHQLDIVKAEREGTTPPVSESANKEKPDNKNSGGGRKWWKSDPRKGKGRTGSRGASNDSAGDREISLDGGLTAQDSEQPENADNFAPLERDGPVFDESVTEPVADQDTTRQEPVARNPDDIDLAPASGFEKLSQIDYYVKLNGDRDVSRESVLAIYREGASELSKRHSIYGLRMPDKVWSDLENEPEESRFADLVITMQLVDQDGPVSEHDMTRFSSLVMKLSESTGRGFAFMASIENACEQAQAIDRFRKRFDSIFVVNIVPLEGEELFEGPVIDRCATQIGLTADDNGFYARYKPMGKQRVCLYSLANFSDTGEFDMDNLRAVRTRGVTFFTRPTINRSPGAVFSEMVDAARAFASRIKGEVIAPGYEDLSNEDVEKIRQSIDNVASEMERYGINPGSDEATRLF